MHPQLLIKEIKMNKLELLELTSKLIAESGMSISELLANTRLLEKYLNTKNNTAPLKTPKFEQFCSELKVQNPITGTVELEYRYFYDNVFDKIETNKEVVINADRQMGMSTFWAVISLYKLIFEPNHTILYLTPSKNDFLNTFRFIFESSPYLGKIGIKHYNSNMIEFDNDSKIFIRQSSEPLMRGLTMNELIIDDADYINYNIFKQIMEAYFPTLATGGKFLMSSYYSGNEESLFLKRFDSSNAGIKIGRD